MASIAGYARFRSGRRGRWRWRKEERTHLGLQALQRLPFPLRALLRRLLCSLSWHRKEEKSPVAATPAALRRGTRQGPLACIGRLLCWVLYMYCSECRYFWVRSFHSLAALIRPAYMYIEHREVELRTTQAVSRSNTSVTSSSKALPHPSTPFLLIVPGCPQHAWLALATSQRPTPQRQLWTICHFSLHSC